jgi:sulfotransferase family protein
MNPYLFIVGCPHSGTTLLRRAVDAHPRIAITRDTHWIPDLVRQARGINLGGRVTSDLPTALTGHPTFATLGIGREELERLAAQRPSYPAFVTALFDIYGARRRKPFVGAETTAHLGDIELLHVMFPHARFVHVVRDGRDVCLSAPEWEPTVSIAARSWGSQVMEGRSVGRTLPPDLYLELRYEPLVADAEGECRRLCDFLCVAFDPAMVRFDEWRRRFEPPAGDWTTQMPRDQVEEFEAAAGDALDAFGYARAAPVREKS